MKITLKKASEFSRALIAAGKAVSVKKTVTMSSFSTADVSTVVDTASSEMFAQIARAQALLAEGYAIRGMIAAANTQAGIDQRLTTIAALDEQIAVLTAVSGEADDDDAYGNTVSVNDMTAVHRRVEQARVEAADPEAKRYRVSGDKITINLVGRDENERIESDLALLKRKRAAVKDEVTALNFTTLVPLPETAQAVLRAEKLID